MVKEYKETHQQGNISLENLTILGITNVKEEILINGDLGIQIAADGRVWVCINGIAFLRFKPVNPGVAKK